MDPDAIAVEVTTVLREAFAAKGPPPRGDTGASSATIDATGGSIAVAAVSMAEGTGIP